jgi:hypothetical protein
MGGMTSAHQVPTEGNHHHIDRHVEDGKRVAMDEQEAPHSQDPSDAREGKREPQTGPESSDQQQTDHAVDHSER